MSTFWQPQNDSTPHPLFYNEQQRYYDPVEFVDDPIPPKSPVDPIVRQRRESHNAVERRRRDTISEKIKELESMIPDDFYDPGTSNLSTCEKRCKSAVLRRSCEYMRHLKSQLRQAQDNQDALLQRLTTLEGSDTSPLSETPETLHTVKQEPIYLDNIE